MFLFSCDRKIELMSDVEFEAVAVQHLRVGFIAEKARSNDVNCIQK